MAGIIVMSLEEIMSCANDEVFSFQSDSDPNDAWHVNATKLRNFIDDQLDMGNKVAELVTVPITRENFEHVLTRNGIEGPRLARLSRAPVIRDQPIMLVDVGVTDGVQEHVCVDGNHRTALRYQAGFRDTKAYLIPRETWEKFKVNFPTDADFMKVALR